ncbi:PQQ-binding-like beta-propeller repeat protein [Saccharopolyspora griseoalba]|uniref:PQQ-binding-like beta-propeller repeat protein n=1 Tax=Saccharopolyspora griseoalba TaxID=1431848 RepID=A0ABW2LIA9_9PSEU
MSRKWWAVLLAAVVLLSAAVTTGAHLAGWPAAGDAPRPATELWSSAGDQEEPLGSWFSSGSLVVARRSSLTGYRATDGGTAWRATGRSLAGDPRADALCGMSGGARDGLGVVAYGTSTSDLAVDCTGVALVDLRTGEPIWRHRLPTAPGRGARAEFVGDLVLLSWDDHVMAVRAADGGEVWRGSAEPGCHLSGPALGPAVVLPQRCPGGSRLVLRDAADGARIADRALGSAPMPQAISADPPVVNTDTTEPDRLLLFARDGSATGILDLDYTGLDVLPKNAPRPGFPRRYPFAVVGGRLIGTAGEGRSITSVDLRSGRLGPVEPGDGVGTAPVAVTGGDVVFAGPGEAGVFTWSPGQRARRPRLGSIARLNPVGDDLHLDGSALYGVSSESPQLYAVRRGTRP